MDSGGSIIQYKNKIKNIFQSTIDKHKYGASSVTLNNSLH